MLVALERTVTQQCCHGFDQFDMPCQPLVSKPLDHGTGVVFIEAYFKSWINISDSDNNFCAMNQLFEIHRPCIENNFCKTGYWRTVLMQVF